MKGARRGRKVSIALTTDEHATLTARAAAHGVPLASYLRNVALGNAPDAAPGSDLADADEWWLSLGGRRAGVHRWLGKGTHRAPDLTDHPTLLDLEGAP